METFAERKDQEIKKSEERLKRLRTASTEVIDEALAEVHRTVEAFPDKSMILYLDFSLYAHKITLSVDDISVAAEILKTLGHLGWRQRMEMEDDTQLGYRDYYLCKEEERIREEVKEDEDPVETITHRLNLLLSLGSGRCKFVPTGEVETKEIPIMELKCE